MVWKAIASACSSPPTCCRPEEGGFHFQRGPLFHNLILADGVNRTPAKVQSALLEAMAK